MVQCFVVKLREKDNIIIYLIIIIKNALMGKDSESCRFNWWVGCGENLLKRLDCNNDMNNIYIIIIIFLCYISLPFVITLL